MWGGEKPRFPAKAIEAPRVSITACCHIIVIATLQSQLCTLDVERAPKLLGPRYVAAKTLLGIRKTNCLVGAHISTTGMMLNAVSEVSSQCSSGEPPLPLQHRQLRVTDAEIAGEKMLSSEAPKRGYNSNPFRALHPRLRAKGVWCNVCGSQRVKRGSNAVGPIQGMNAWSQGDYRGARQDRSR